VAVFAEKPWTGEVRPACTAFLTYVHLGEDLRPRPAPAFLPETAGERRRWEAALARREARVVRVKRLRAAIRDGEAGPVAAGV
jgi:acyl-CoA hydrolase